MSSEIKFKKKKTFNNAHPVHTFSIKYNKTDSICHYYNNPANRKCVPFYMSNFTWGKALYVTYRGSSLNFNTSKRLFFFYLIIYSPAENSVPTVHDQLVLMAETVWKSETISLL